ncbi:dentin sialophosphoprotein, partial [Vibrio alginolyticus]
MTLNKTGLALAMSAILFSGSLIANEIDDGDDNMQWTDSANTDIGLSGSFNDNSDNSASLGVGDSFNDNSDNSASLGIGHSFNDNSDTDNSAT